METNTITIPFSKRKTFVWLLGAIVFVVAGCWLLFGNPKLGNGLFDNPWFTKAVGIDDYSSAVAVKIYWKDIEAIEVMQIQSQQIMLVKVSNPQTYIDREKDLKRKMMAMNYKWYSTPLSISANGLQISFDELLQLIASRFENATSTKT